MRFHLKFKFAFVPISLLLISNLFSFNFNEKLKFKIKYGFISAGYATLTVKDSVLYKDKKCIKFISTTRTNSTFDHIFKVRDFTESVWDPLKKISYKYLKKLNEGSYHQYRIHLYYQNINASYYLRYSFKKNKFKQTRMDIPAKTQDVLSAFYSIREKTLIPGDSVIVNVTVDGVNYPATILIHKSVKLQTIFGELDCIPVEPLLQSEAVFKQNGRILIYLTNDNYKLPVLLESKVIFGSFKAVLMEAKNVPYE